MKILLFGMFSPSLSGEPIAQGFEQKGHQVVRISVEPIQPSRAGKFDFHVMDEYGHSRTKGMSRHDFLTEVYRLQTLNRRLYLREYIDKYPDADCVVFIQNKYAWDFEGSTLPIYYYHTDIISTNLPLHADLIRGFFYAYIGAVDEMNDSHTYEYNHWWWRDLIPYGCDLGLYSNQKSWEDREIFCGFMGSLAQNDRSQNGLKAHIYDDRNRVIRSLVERKYKGFVMNPFRSVQQYAQFLGNCQIGINIPGTYGKINQRQFEVLAAGALLLQWWYPELKDLGLVDFENCLTFTSIDSLLDNLQWIKDHPKEANTIRLKGIQYFQDHQCSWQARAGAMIDRITREPTTREMDWINWVEYERKKERDPTIKEEYPIQMYVVK